MKLETTLKSLGVFNLNLYEAKAYLALLEREILSPVEVAAISGVPRGRIYEVLNKLLDKGLSNLIPGPVKQYKATNPDIFKEKIEAKVEDSESDINMKISIFQSDIENRKKVHDSEIRRKKEEFNTKINRLTKEFESKTDKEKRALNDLRKNANDVVKKLTDVYKKGRNNNIPYERIEILINALQSEAMYVQLLEESKNEMLFLSKHKFTNIVKDPRRMKVVESQVKVQVDKLKKGFISKCIYEIALDDPNDIEPYCEKAIDKYVEAGQQAKVMKDLPMRIVIFDEKVTMFTPLDDMGKDFPYLTQVVRSEVMAKSHKLLFDMLWEKAEDYEAWRKRLNI